MANNDRVTQNPDPSWIADSKSSGNPLVTKATNGQVGWNSEEKTRNLLSRDSFNKAGWRNKKVIPAGMATIDYDSTLFEITDHTSGDVIETGGYVEVGSYVDIRLLPLGLIPIDFGCWAEISNGRISERVFFKSFGTIEGRDVADLLENVQVIGNFQVVGTAKRRSFVNIGCQTGNTITASIEVTSWGEKGHQTVSMALTSSWGEPDGLEIYVGDEVTYNFVVNNEYHWANFKRGTSASSLLLVNKSLVVYPTGMNGGRYVETAINGTLYLDMDAVKPISFYLYQDGSDTFTNTKVRVKSLAQNLEIYKNITLPRVGTQIDYGRNGTARNHVPLYVGMSVEIYCTSDAFVAAGKNVSYTSLSPAPTLPDDPEYEPTCVVTIPGNANQNGYVCVGLRYLNLNYKGGSVSAEISTTQTDTFKNFMDALYYGGTTFNNYIDARFKRKYNLNTPSSNHDTALKIWPVVNDRRRYSWEVKLTGYFQTQSIDSNHNSSIYAGDEVYTLLSDGNVYALFEADGLNFGAFSANFFGYLRQVFASDHTSCDTYLVSDAINCKTSAPVADWYLPDDPTRYIPLNTLLADWGTKPWEVKTEVIVNLYFTAITKEA